MVVNSSAVLGCSLGTHRDLQFKVLLIISLLTPEYRNTYKKTFFVTYL